MKRSLIGIGVALVLGAPAGAEPSAEEVLACMRKNAPQTALVQSIEIVSLDRDAKERRQSAKLSVKRSDDGFGRLLLEVEEPADLRGTRFLLIQKKKGSDMFVYLPELKKVKRVSARNLRGKLLGSDFSYEEVEQLFAQGSQSDAVRLPDAEKNGRPVYVLEAAPAADSGSEYRKVTSFVDRETCVPLQIDFFEKGETPRKQVTIDAARITREGEVHVPRLVRMQDLAKQTESRLVTHAVQVDPDLPDGMFSRDALESSRD